MRILIDTNILLRIVDSAHPLHPLANSAISALYKDGHELIIVPQVLYEFWGVATRTLAANGLGESPAFARAFIGRFCGAFRFLRDDRQLFDAWLDLVTIHQISGVKSYDARLAAAMLRHSISHFLTFNPSDFRRFSHVTILEPALVVAQ